MSGKRSNIGKRKDLDNQFFRSSWEANWARYLNMLKDAREIRDWKYEAETFEFTEIKRGTRFYTPDFLVFENDGTETRYEIKGYMDAGSKTKLKRMAKYYPEVEITLIQKEEYYAVHGEMKNFIPYWETNQKRAR